MFGARQIYFTRLFTSITHLDVSGHVDEWDWSALTRLPHLTHLTVNDERYLKLPRCLTLFQKWEALQALVMLVYDGDGRMPEVDDDLSRETRFVMMARDIGRALIAKRKSGKVNPLEYFIDPEDKVDSEDN
ncbi:hypothetical protein B0H19DRAFT_1258830 [Mycena capillaripes]|nr:hypothetical protein B0H19DRAFT_1258830 [Mycena capillaripes]